MARTHARTHTFPSIRRPTITPNNTSTQSRVLRITAAFRTAELRVCRRYHIRRHCRRPCWIPRVTVVVVVIVAAVFTAASNQPAQLPRSYPWREITFYTFPSLPTTAVSRQPLLSRPAPRLSPPRNSVVERDSGSQNMRGLTRNPQLAETRAHLHVLGFRYCNGLINY